MLSYRCHEVLPCFVFAMAHGIYCCIVQPNSNTAGIAVNPHFDGTIIDLMRILQALPLLSNGEPHSPGLLKSRIDSKQYTCTKLIFLITSSDTLAQEVQPSQD